MIKTIISILLVLTAIKFNIIDKSIPSFILFTSLIIVTAIFEFFRVGNGRIPMPSINIQVPERDKSKVKKEEDKQL